MPSLGLRLSGFVFALAVSAGALAACSDGDAERARELEERLEQTERQLGEAEAELEQAESRLEEALESASASLERAEAGEARIAELETELEGAERALIQAWASEVGGLGKTIGEIIDRGELNCGVKWTQPLFGQRTADGGVAGFDIEFCKALAAAVLDDPNAVHYVDASDPYTRFDLLAELKIDVLIRTTTVTFSRDAHLGVDFVQPTFYAGQGFAVRRDSGIARVADLDGATICVQTGTRLERNLAGHFENSGLDYVLLGDLSGPDLWDAFFASRCDALTGDSALLASLISERGDASDYAVLGKLISKEPLAPVVRDDDPEWKDAVNWVVQGLIAAEELGITSRNAEAMADSPPNVEIALLLGAPFEGEERALGFHSLDGQFIRRAILAVGNYGEIYEREIGDVIPRACTLNALATDDSVDCPPGTGGILYALPYR